MLQAPTAQPGKLRFLSSLVIHYYLMSCWSCCTWATYERANSLESKRIVFFCVVDDDDRCCGQDETTTHSSFFIFTLGTCEQKFLDTLAGRDRKMNVMCRPTVSIANSHAWRESKYRISDFHPSRFLQNSNPCFYFASPHQRGHCISSIFVLQSTLK
jgi:hypothetical protein